MNKTFKGLPTTLPENSVFVFFSNSRGIAETKTQQLAYNNFGAVLGKYFNTIGNSYGICLSFLTTPKVERSFLCSQVATLYRIAESRDTHKEFYIIYNGKDIYGYTARELIDVFKSLPIPKNIIFEEGFYKLFNSKTQYELETEV